MHTLILIAWFTPVLCAAMLVIGSQRARISGRRSPILPPRLLIIQITTVGNERTVNEIIRRIHGYQLDIPFSIWVVTEPGADATYHGVDELIVVPKDFRAARRTRHGRSNTRDGSASNEGWTTSSSRSCSWTTTASRPRATSRRCSGRSTTCVRASPRRGTDTGASCRTWTTFGRSTASTCARCSRGSVIRSMSTGKGSASEGPPSR